MIRKLLTRLVVLVGVVLAVSLLAELYLRGEVTYVVRRGVQSGLVESDPEMLVLTTRRGRRLVANAQVTIRNHYLSQRDVDVLVNEVGFRAPPLAESEHGRRIVLLGDSITISDYLPIEETFGALLEQQLRATYQDVHVLNAGIGNTGIEEQVRLLEDTVARVAPRLVVLNHYLNDSRPPWGFSGEIGERGWLRRHSVLVETTYRTAAQMWWVTRTGREQFQWIPAVDSLPWRHNPEAFSELVELARYDWGAAWQEESWKVVDESLERLQQLAAKHAFQLAVAMFPVAYQVSAEALHDEPQQKMRALTGSRGIPFFDLLSGLRERSHQALFYDQCHLTPEGQRVTAELLLPFVEQLLREGSANRE